MDTKKLRQKILDLAIHGKLVPQDPNDEPASVLLERIRAEKERLIKEGKIKVPKRSKSTSGTSHYPKEGPWELPKGWEWCAINDVSTSELGKTLDKNKNSGEEKPYLCALNVKWNSFDLTTIKTIKIEKYEQERYRLRPGDLLVCEGGDVGRCAIWKSDAEFYYQNALHRVRCNSMIIPQYLLTVLRYYKDIGLIDEISKGVTIKHFTSQVFQTLRFPIPPVKEQRRIISCITFLFENITHIDNDSTKLLTLTNNTKALVLDLAIHGKLVLQDPNDEPAIELLRRINPGFKPSDNLHYEGSLPKGWCFSTLGELFQHNTGKALNTLDDKGEMMRYITTSNLYWNRFDLTEVRTMFFTEAEQEKCRVIKGDLLVCEGGDIGRAAIWPYDKSIMIQNHIHRLRPKAQVSVRYFYYILNLYKREGLIGGKGIGIQGLSSRELDKLIVAVPPIREQNEIVIKIDELFSLLDALVNTCIS